MPETQKEQGLISTLSWEEISKYGKPEVQSDHDRLANQVIGLLCASTSTKTGRVLTEKLVKEMKDGRI